MGHFNFTDDINQYKFKSQLRTLSYRQQELVNANLEILFKKLVTEFIAKRKSVESFSLMIIWGFKTQEAVQNFLNDPGIFSELKRKTIIPSTRLSAETLLKIKSTYNKALAHQQLTQDHDTAELLALFEIFALIKSLSNEEITIIEQYLPAYAQAYFGDSTLLNFKDDLNQMSALEFEGVHAGCFSGMLTNVIKPLIATEVLFSWLEKGPQEDNTMTQLILT